MQSRSALRMKATPSMLEATFFVMVLVFALAPSRASATPERLLSLSARGPGKGDGVLSVGGRVFFFGSQDEVPPLFPTIELSYARALADRVDFEARLGSFLLLNFLETGTRVRLVEGDGFSMAVHGDLIGLQGYDEEPFGVAMAGLEPGVIASFPGENLEISFQLDVPMFFVGTEFYNAAADPISWGFGYAVRPSIGIETTLTERVGLFVQAQAYFREAHQPVPSVSIGAIF